MTDNHADDLVIRSHRVGDIGYITFRHGVLYAQEHGYGDLFEAYVARIVSDFVREYESTKDRLWIAELKEEIVGAIAIMKASGDVGRLRLFYVEPRARGRRIGQRLLEEALAFARTAGYLKLVLHTQSNLTQARVLYERAGFRCVKRLAHVEWGDGLTDEHWQLVLSDRSLTATSSE